MGTLVFEVLRSNFNHTQRTCRIDKKEREKKKNRSHTINLDEAFVQALLNAWMLENLVQFSKKKKKNYWRIYTIRETE